MKRLTLLFALLITTALGASAQIEDPVSWAFGSKKISSTEAVVYLKATIEDGWHVYSQNVKPGGPIKTTIKFAPSKEFSKVGVTAEPKAITKYEKTFAMNVSYFENEVVFSQKVKLVKGQALVKGTIEFMTCNDRKCLPPSEVPFSVQVK
ncbi:protein-disulfide reductase DsbD domain-containing protein [Pedobacter duraquae]|uniref:Disulfide bond corrector protein DsbC n=1 Tax=Pedobacter duraquae TaxID=425511 RepID=A0A4R6IEB8_9SPHI|nr:protein-disulfide reductase DsbD domain-containing protein [Pedobacter duraquae]TDO19255.1 disulfide bond corrector protein DsbC [Pedobacter duraquae]